jgi:hypothetical protein
LYPAASRLSVLHIDDEDTHVTQEFGISSGDHAQLAPGWLDDNDLKYLPKKE